MTPHERAGRRVRWRSGAAGLAAVLAACSERPRTATIGYASNTGSPSAATVAQAVLEETHRADGMRVVVSRGDSVPRQRAGGALLREVELAIRFAADSHVVAVVGPGGSREALQTAPVYRDAGVPNVVPTATSRRLHALGSFWTFLLAPNDSVQGEFIGDFAADELGARSATVFYLPDEYGLGLASGTAAALARRGIKLLAKSAVRPGQACPPRDAQNAYDGVVRDAWRRGTPDVVVLAARTPETACVARAVSGRAAHTRFIAGDGALVTPAFLQMAGPVSDSIYFVAFWTSARVDSASRAFAERFRTIVGREPRHDDAMFYDAVMVVNAAINAVGPDRTAVRDYLAELGRSRPAYRGVTGSIAFTARAHRPLLMTRLHNGRAELVPSQ